LQLRQQMGQMTGQLEELKSTVDDVSRKVRRHDTILSSRGATGSRVRDRSFELRPLTFTPLQFCLEGDHLRSEVRSVQDLMTLGDGNSLQRLAIQPGVAPDRRFPATGRGRLGQGATTPTPRTTRPGAACRGLTACRAAGAIRVPRSSAFLLAPPPPGPYGPNGAAYAASGSPWCCLESSTGREFAWLNRPVFISGL
jgi:hypothetical protein